jgi:hypothetical protein
VPVARRDIDVAGEDLLAVLRLLNGHRAALIHAPRKEVPNAFGMG